MSIALDLFPRKTRYSVDDLDQFPDDGKLRELVDGQIVEWDVTTPYHGWLLVTLSHALRSHVLERKLGLVVGGDPLVMVQGSRYDARCRCSRELALPHLVGSPEMFPLAIAEGGDLYYPVALGREDPLAEQCERRPAEAAALEQLDLADGTFRGPRRP